MRTRTRTACRTPWPRRKVEENTKALAGASGQDDANDDALANDNTADNVGEAVTATDTKADGNTETLTYSLGGTDAAMFRVREQRPD